jgi:hypothetical protein
MKPTRNALILTAALAACLASSAQTPSPAVVVGTRLPISNPTLPAEVLVQGPTQAPGDLQIICLFQSVPDNKLLASLALMDQQLGGLLTKVRTSGLFRGDLGETLLLTPKPGVIVAHRLLIIGLGDRTTFTAQREELVGEIAYEESERLGVAAPTFAPTVIDGGFNGTDTGSIGGYFVKGFLRGRAIATALHAASAGPSPTVARFTFLAGEAHALDTQKGIASVLNTAQSARDGSNSAEP